jgi:F0F1-type ATP synthase membrane subunit c/vacuolar-type H+-ATPase subunit K
MKKQTWLDTLLPKQLTSLTSHAGAGTVGTGTGTGVGRVFESLATAVAEKDSTTPHSGGRCVRDVCRDGVTL